MCICQSQSPNLFLCHPISPLVTVSLFSTSVSLFLKNRPFLPRSFPMVFYTQDFITTYRFFCCCLLTILKVSLTAYINLSSESGPCNSSSVFLLISYLTNGTRSFNLQFLLFCRCSTHGSPGPEGNHISDVPLLDSPK